MSEYAFQEWLNRNAHRAFPVVEDSDLSCESGAVFPNGILLDARFFCFGPSYEGCTLDFATVTQGSAVVGFTCAGEEIVVSGSGLFSGTTGNVSWMVRLCDSDRMGDMDGDYRLLSPAPILPSRVVFVRNGIGVDSIAVGDVSATGDVSVVDGHNTTLDVHGNDLRLRVGDGLGKGRKCVEHGGDYICDGAVLYYLNGQKAGSDGNIELKGGAGVVVSSGTYKGIPAIIVETDESVNGFVYK